MTKTIYLLISFALFLSFGKLQAQDLEITNAATLPFTPENLITNIFLGEGVEVLSVTYSGDPQAVGYFKNGENEVGIDRGILLTSGQASGGNCTTTLGGECTGNQFASNDNSGGSSENDLNQIATGGLNDVAKYTIVFRPTADTLRFKYVFASEEYPEWACSSFNDVFGFFISGPGINGPFENNGMNIALIPGTTTPVTINNIHPQNGGGCPAAFAQYYNNNDGTNLQPVYDGFLDVFIAEAVVIPCEIYTIKLTVADVGDNAFDTGVFLEAKSFGAPSLNVETSTVSLDGTITEGCADGSITFSFENPVESDLPLDYTIIGTAENGVDYESVPLDLFIPQGDSTITVNIIGIQDAIDEGLESIGIDIQRDVCNRDTFWLFIRDNEILPPNLPPDTTLCRGDSMLLDGTLPIPLPDPPTFTNTQDYPFSNTSPAYSPILVAGVQPVTLGPGVIQSVCLNIAHKWADDIDLFLITPNGQFLELSSDNGQDCDDYVNTCFVPTGSTLSFQDLVPIGYDCAAGEMTGFTGNFSAEGVWSDLWDGDYPTNGTWQLLALDDQQGFNGTILDWTITFEPLYQVFYKWEPATGLSCADCPDPMAQPDQTTTYHLTAWDTYGCEVYDSITIEVKDRLPAPDVTCTNIGGTSITFGWPDVPGSMGYMVSIDGAPFTVPNNGALSHIVNGLTASDTVTIEVFGIGECDGDIGTAICNTPPCDAPTLNIDAQSDLSCPTDTDGSVTVSATGGAGNYVFTLGTQTNSTGVFIGLAAGEHVVSVSDDLNCTVEITVTISAPNGLAITPVLVHDITCFGLNDGEASVEVTGGTYPYTFIWNGGFADSIATGLHSGTQTISVVDANGCSLSGVVEILEPAQLNLSVVGDNASCFNVNDGEATATAAGGTAPLLYQWDAAAGNQTTPTADGLTAGVYQVVVTDGNGCTISGSANISQPTELTIALTPTDPLCENTQNGLISVTANGGTPLYNYAWSNGDVTNTADSLSAGTWTVTVSDANSCSATTSATLVAPPAIVIQFDVDDANCFGTATGGLVANVSGGNAPYSYVWDNGGGGPSITSILAGEHCLIIYDSHGCSDTACATVGEPSEIVLSYLSENAGCDGGNFGSIDVTALGGTEPFVYQWNTTATTEDLTGLVANTYLLGVSDANGCDANLSVEITENPPIEISFDPTDVLCFEGDNGAVDASILGGSGNYTFTWSGPGSFSSQNEDIATLQAGNYTLVVNDDDHCSATANIMVTEPATAVAVNIAPPDIICFSANDGTATAMASGGVAPYNYMWSNSQNAPTATTLTAGTYTVTATDGNGCTATQTVAIAEEEQILVTLEQTAAACNNGTDGTASIAGVKQGNANIPLNSLTILWNNGGSTPTISDLTADQTYSVIVTNANGCTGTASIAIGNPSAVVASIISTEDIKCTDGLDGSAQAIGAGGQTPYNYKWDAAANGQITDLASDLAAGTYEVTVTDANGCTDIAQATLTEPEALALNFDNQDISCFGYSDGSANALPSGGVGPFQYLWSTGATGSLQSDLPAGDYSVTLTDGNGCTVSEQTAILEPQNPLSAKYLVQDVTCPGLKNGKITIETVGGTPPYRYSFDGTNFIGNSGQIALESGTYQVWVKDANDCLIQSDPMLLEEPLPILLDLGPDTLVWYGTKIHITPVILNYDNLDLLTYTWTSNNPANQPTHPEWRVGEFFVTSPATAFLTVVDSNGCKSEDLINIFVRELREINVPTAFAPGNGGDALNDFLHVHGNTQLDGKVKTFRVFDRWGELLFEAVDFDVNDMGIGWDGTFKGKDMPAGVYVWYAEVDFVDGESASYKGHTTLIR